MGRLKIRATSTQFYRFEIDDKPRKVTFTNVRKGRFCDARVGR